MSSQIGQENTDQDATAQPEKKRPNPFAVTYEYHDRRDQEYKMKARLENGEVPQIIIEDGRLIGQGETESADRIITYIKTILDRLSQATTNQPCPPMRIYLSDVQGANAGIITSGNPPILIIGLELIESLHAQGFGEDHLAAILGHERLHFLRSQKWKGLKNGRPEETVGDVFGVIEATKAGYNPGALGQFFKYLINKRKKNEKQGKQETSRSFQALMGEHPILQNRVRNCELALANLQLTQRLEEKFTDFPAEIIQAVNDTHFTPHFEPYAAATNFENASPPEKVRLISDYFLQELHKRDLKEEDYRYEKDENGERQRISYTAHRVDQDLMALRLYGPYQRLRDLHGTEGVKEEAEKQLYRLMGENPEKEKERSYNHNRDHYRWVLEQLLSLSSQNPIPSHWYHDFYNTHKIPNMRSDQEKVHLRSFAPSALLKLIRKTEEFWEAQTAEEALQARDDYQAAVKELSDYGYGMDALSLYPTAPEWPSRWEIKNTLNGNETCRLPWENICQLILKSEEPEKSQLKETAIRLGCDDPRLTGKAPASYRLGNSSHNALEFDHLHFDEQGNIVRLELSQEEIEEQLRKRFHSDTAAQLYAQEYDMQKEREAAEESALQTTNWDEMEQDFWVFVEKNEEYLTPVHTVVPGNFPFAEMFMQHLQAHVKNDPEKWHSTYITFMAGADPDAGLEEDNRGIHRPQIHPFSLPDLLCKHENKYIGYTTPYDSCGAHRDLERGKLPSTHPMARRLKKHKDSRRKMMRHRTNPKTGKLKRYEVSPPRVTKDKEHVEMLLRVDNNHPYLAALLSLDDRDIYPSKRANIVSNFRYYNPDASTMDSYFKISPRRVFNQAAFNTHHAFRRLQDKLDDHPTNLGPSHIWAQTFPFELLRTLRRLEKGKPKKRFAVSQIPYLVLTEDFKNIFKDKDVAQAYQRELKKHVERQIRRNRKIDFKKSVPLKTLIKRFVQDHGEEDSRMYSYATPDPHNIFSMRPHLEKSYQQHIRTRIMQEPESTRAELLTPLMGLPIKDPAFRKWTIETWVHSISGKIGKDFGEKEYAKAALEIINDAIYTMDTAQGIECITLLLDRIEAQREVALEAKEILVQAYGQKFFEKDGTMRVIESAVDLCANDNILRDAFLTYITEPLSAKGTAEFAHLLKDRTASNYSAPEFVSQFFNPEKHINLSGAQQQTVVDFLHQNFWSMPFEMRTVYLDRILFPVDNDDNEDHFNNAVTFILDKVLPEEKKFAKEAREALLIYLDTCPPELRRTTFSAILATTEQAAQTGDIRPGQVLSYVLARTGAAGGQLLQAAHSYLSGIDVQDPDLIQFRDDLKSSKIDFSRPKRWEIFERMDEALPQNMLDTMKTRRIGATLGSGSTAYVIAVGEGEDETALKLMRSDVVPIAELQFERFQAAFETLADKHTHYAPLPSMVDSARALLETSTNGHIGKQQVDYAEQEYSALSITVGHETFDFNVAKAINAGDEYLETQCLHGPHLNDLNAGSEKTIRSIAIETAEIYLWLQGKATDKDRHGGQQKITGHTIGMFDVGQLPYDLEARKVKVPQPHEKKALGQLLGLVLNANLKGESTIDALTHALHGHDWGEAHAYLVGEQRAFLARMDVHQGLNIDPKKRVDLLADIFKAVWNAGQIDRDIFAGISETISLSSLKTLAKQKIDAQNNTIHIAITDAATQKAEPQKYLSAFTAGKMLASSMLKRSFNAVSPFKTRKSHKQKKPAPRP